MPKKNHRSRKSKKSVKFLDKIEHENYINFQLDIQQAIINSKKDFESSCKTDPEINYYFQNSEMEKAILDSEKDNLIDNIRTIIIRNNEELNRKITLDKLTTKEIQELINSDADESTRNCIREYFHFSKDIECGYSDQEYLYSDDEELY